MGVSAFKGPVTRNPSV